MPISRARLIDGIINLPGVARGRGHVSMMATVPPAEADLFNSFIMQTYGRYPITMVK